METRISSSSMDNANKIKTSVMLLLLYGTVYFRLGMAICLFC